MDGQGYFDWLDETVEPRVYIEKRRNFDFN